MRIYENHLGIFLLWRSRETMANCDTNNIWVDIYRTDKILCFSQWNIIKLIQLLLRFANASNTLDSPAYIGIYSFPIAYLHFEELPCFPYPSLIPSGNAQHSPNPFYARQNERSYFTNSTHITVNQNIF